MQPCFFNSLRLSKTKELTEMNDLMPCAAGHGVQAGSIMDKRMKDISVNFDSRPRVGTCSLYPCMLTADASIILVNIDSAGNSATG